MDTKFNKRANSCRGLQARRAGLDLSGCACTAHRVHNVRISPMWGVSPTEAMCSHLPLQRLRFEVLAEVLDQVGQVVRVVRDDVGTAFLE